MSNITRYYVTGHTANGKVNYLSSNLYNINQIICLQSESNEIKTNIFRRLITYLINETNDEIEVIHNHDRIHYIDGVIIRDKSIAILSNELMRNNDSHVNVIDLIIDEHPQSTWNKEKEKYIEKAYDYFKQSLKIHDQLEHIYLREMDFNKADQVAEEFIKTYFTDIKKEQQPSHIYERLFGTNTADGSHHVVAHLIENIEHRFFIKGRAGTGKSHFMRAILKVCQQYHLDVEVYYCSFDPQSIDMLIIRSLDYCLFDSTSPHEFFPTKSTDKVIDLYELTVTPKTDERFKNEIKRVTNQYRMKFKKGLSQLKRIKYFDKSSDQTLTDERFNTIMREIKSYLTKTN